MTDVSNGLKNRGINKLLVEARLNLKLSRKEAAKNLGISRAYLMRIEKGYAIVQEKYRERFINTYGLDKDFFNDLCYPVPVDFDEYKQKKSSKVYEFFLSTKFKIIAIILSVGFLAQTISSVMCLPVIRGNTREFFNDKTFSTYQYVLNNGVEPGEEDKNSELGILVLDKRLTIKLAGETSDNYKYLKINQFISQRNLPYAFFQGEYSEIDESKIYRVVFEHRYIGSDSIRAHCYLMDSLNPTSIISRMSADIKYIGQTTYDYNFISVSSIIPDVETKILSNNDPLYQKYTTIFKNKFALYDTDLEKLFSTKLKDLNTSYNEYSKEMNHDVGSFTSYRYAIQVLLTLGLLFAAIFIILVVTSFIKKTRLNKKLALLKIKEIPDEVEENDYSDVKVNAELTPVPKNKGINLFINEFGVRIISLLFLFLSSMVTYFVFVDGLHLAVPSQQVSDTFRNLISNLSVVAVLTLYFLKLDIYQNKKNAAAFSWFLFIAGLLYYLLIVVVYFVMESVTGSADSLGTLLNYFPGNIIWAVLVFNAITIFLFSKPNFKHPTPKKRLAFRLCTIIPLSYLIISCVVSIGMTAFDWNVHYLISSLLFFKAPYITVFALFYTAFVFVYRRRTVKKYGEENALLYQQGNKYNLNRNIAACVIILALALVDLTFMFVFPNNKFGFGTNTIILIAIPLLLFYRPHFGKRNGTWDFWYYLLYVFVYIAGILAIVIAVLNFLTTI